MTRKIDMVRVDRTEYEALCTLRDGVHETTRLRVMQLEEHYKQCLAINLDQCGRLNTQDLQITHAREKLAAQEREIARLTAEVKKYKPATLSVPPPPKR